MAEQAKPTIVTGDLPGLFQAADTSSAAAQKLYLKLVAADLSVMLVGAALGALSVSGSRHAQLLALASAISVAIGLVLTLTLQSQRLSAIWYDGRAVAEATKTSAWRYMMRAYPYGDEVSDADVDRSLTSAFDSFLRDRRGLAGSLPSSLAQLPQITTAMRDTRVRAVADRKAVYVESRLTDQRLWYAARAEHNSKRAKLLFMLVIACHALALVAAIANVRWPESPFNLTGVFAALAAALIAWTQLKKYEEQANVYGLTAQELRSIEEQGRHANAEDTFSRFVEEAESAITRENAIWLARREQY